MTFNVGNQFHHDTGISGNSDFSALFTEWKVDEMPTPNSCKTARFDEICGPNITMLHIFVG